MRAIESLERMVGIHLSKRQAEKIILATSYYFYEQRKYDNEKSTNLPLLILTLDGKGVAMRKKSLRKETKERGEKNSHKLKQRLSSGEKNNAKRMAVVASVSEV